MSNLCAVPTPELGKLILTLTSVSPSPISSSRIPVSLSKKLKLLAPRFSPSLSMVPPLAAKDWGRTRSGFVCNAAPSISVALNVKVLMPTLSRTLKAPTWLLDVSTIWNGDPESRPCASLAVIVAIPTCALYIAVEIPLDLPTFTRYWPFTGNGSPVVSA